VRSDLANCRVGPRHQFLGLAWSPESNHRGASEQSSDVCMADGSRSFVLETAFEEPEMEESID
jgi:hypothetical protein